MWLLKVIIHVFKPKTVSYSNFVIMKKQVERLNKMFRVAAHGKTWHGQNILQTLENVSFEIAAAYPIEGGHCIWDYLLHIINWREFAVKALLRDEPYVIELNTDKDWTPISDFSEKAWEKAIELYKKSTDDLSIAILNIDDNRLEEIVPGHEYTFYTLLHGVIQHDIYHSGQIVLLKKMMKTN